MNDYGRLTRNNYGTPQNPSPRYEPDVNLYRTGALLVSGFDLVIGPVAKEAANGKWVANPALPNQYKFETENALTKFKLVGIVPVFDSLEA